MAMTATTLSSSAGVMAGYDYFHTFVVPRVKFSDKVDYLLRNAEIYGKASTGISQFSNLPSMEILHGFRNTSGGMPRKMNRRKQMLMRGRQNPRREIIPIHCLAKRQLQKRNKVSLSMRMDGSVWAKVDIFIDEPKCRARMKIVGGWQKIANAINIDDELGLAKFAGEWYAQGFLVRNRVSKSKQFLVYRALNRMGPD